MNLAPYSLKIQFKIFIQKMYPGVVLPPDQYKQLEQAFYAGIGQHCLLLMQVAKDHPGDDEKQAAATNSMWQQANNYIATMGQQN